MSRETDLRNELSRIEKIKRWQKRLDRLRKRDDMSEAQFCVKYGFNRSWFNRIKRMDKAAEQESFERVEKALADIGV